MTNKILSTLVLFTLLTVIPKQLYAADNKLTEQYIDKYQEIFSLEKEIISNLSFSETSHFPFTRTLYGSAKSITLSDNLKGKWIFTIHPLTITPYVMETMSKMLRLAQIPTKPIYAYTLTINGQEYVGSLEKEYKSQFLKTITAMLHDEAKVILSQEPISYLFEAQFKTLYDQDKVFFIHPVNKVYYYTKDSENLSDDDFTEIFQYDKSLFSIDTLNQLQKKNHSFWTQGINPDNNGTPASFFKIPFLRGYSREYCKRIHKYCMKNSISSNDQKTLKIISFFNTMPKKQFTNFLDIKEINDKKIYKEYKASIMWRKKKMADYFNALYKSLMPTTTLRNSEFTNNEIKVYTDALKNKEKKLKQKLKEAKANKKPQTSISSAVYPEAWLVSYNTSIKVLKHDTAYASMLKLIEKAKNDIQKKTASIYLKSMPKPKVTKPRA